MKRIKLLLKNAGLLAIILVLLLSNVSCSSKKNEYYVTWNDADGSLIDYAAVDSDFDPASRELPAGNDQWQYTGWNVHKSGNRIECTALRVRKTKLQWIDAEGTILKEEYVVYSSEDPITYPLPEDSNQWHYIEWSRSTTADGYIYTARRVPKEHYIWLDSDGSTLREEFVIEGHDVPSFDLPLGTEKWTYLEWESTIENGSHIYTAKRTPNASYFAGNVFQIIIKDADGTPLGTGSGFIINDDGWFITNDHVMRKASSAVAFFDIKDQKNGSRYTQLNVIGGLIADEEKDIFIGKLDGYEVIKSYYQNIGFTNEYETGENAYTIGYPNSSVKMEINSGVILEEYSDIYDKINGVYYILSDSYIAPGSSGGVLVNENFEVIGITTIGLYADDNKQVYTAGGSVPAFVFSAYLSNLDESKIQILTDIYNKGEV